MQSTPRFWCLFHLIHITEVPVLRQWELDVPERAMTGPFNLQFPLFCQRQHPARPLPTCGACLPEPHRSLDSILSRFRGGYIKADADKAPKSSSHTGTSSDSPSLRQKPPQPPCANIYTSLALTRVNSDMGPGRAPGSGLPENHRPLYFSGGGIMTHAFTSSESPSPHQKPPQTPYFGNYTYRVPTSQPSSSFRIPSQVESPRPADSPPTTGHPATSGGAPTTAERRDPNEFDAGEHWIGQVSPASTC